MGTEKYALDGERKRTGERYTAGGVSAAECRCRLPEPVHRGRGRVLYGAGAMALISKNVKLPL